MVKAKIFLSHNATGSRSKNLSHGAQTAAAVDLSISWHISKATSILTQGRWGDKARRKRVKMRYD